MEQEINARQEEIQRVEGHEEVEVLEKDDFISGLIYCVVRGGL